MTTIQIPVVEAQKLATAAIEKYKKRLAAFPVALNEDDAKEQLSIWKTGKSLSGIDASESQRQAALKLLQGEENRRALDAALERCTDLAKFFSFQSGNTILGVYTSLSFDDWVFMSKAETLEP